jgi:C-5 cytosine-specific DNA methylase
VGRALAIDLYCGLGGWSSGLLAEGWDVLGFDIERHVYGEHRYPAQLVIQDVRTLHGSQFREASLIVASPPCQFFSYCAMPWTRAKQLAREVRADSNRLEKELALFNACFRIQREACEAAGRHIPMVVENVRGAIPWVGRARFNFGSFYLWGDVPALMPFGQTIKHGGDWFRDPTCPTRQGGQNGRKYDDGIKHPGNDISAVGFNVAGQREFGPLVKGAAYQRTEDDKRQHIGVTRKFASAMIARIPLPLSQHIAATFHPNVSA